MKKSLQQYGAFLLLVILSVSFIPLESFHHHEEELVVCHNETEHMESKRFECSLSDYTTPVFLTNQTGVNFEVSCLLFFFKIEEVRSVLATNYCIQKYRGPPLLS